MAETALSIHEPVPSASVQVSNADLGTAGSNQLNDLAKTKSLQILESHSVEEHLLQELWFARIIVKYPCYLLWFIVLILMALGFIINAVHTLDIASQIYGTERTWSDSKDFYVEQYDAYHLAAEFVVYANETDNSTTLPQTEDSYYMFFYFTDKNYDDDMDSSSNYWILDKENIELMIEYENKIMLDEDWKKKFCYVGEDPVSTNYSCSTSVSSIARTIYELSDYATMSDGDIKEWVLDNYDSLYFFMNLDADTYEQVYRVRSFFTAGTPFSSNWSVINGTSTRESNYSDDEEYDLLVNWVDPFWQEITVDEKAGLTEGDLNIMFYDVDTFYSAIFSEAEMAVCFLGAIVIVGLYMCFHVKSCCLGCGAMIQILLSFILAFFCYRVFFQIDYVDILTFMIIFVILGIGADDVFVFTDAWHQSSHFVDTSSVERKISSSSCGSCQDEDEEMNIMKMSFTFRRAASAMLTTQTTTFFAFIGTTISNLMGIKAFGLWAATVVACNYVLVITLYPVMLMIHERMIKNWEDPLMAYTCCICCTLWKKKESANSETEEEDTADNFNRALSVNDGVGDVQEYRATEKFFGRTWSKWMNKSAIWNLCLFFLISVVALILTCHMKVQDGAEYFVKSNSWLHQFEIITTDFGISEEDGLAEAHITYGISGVDRSDMKAISSSDYVGDVTWDDDFEMYTTEQQEYLYSICQTLKNSSLVYESPNSEYVTCPIEQWKAYLISMNESFPYDAESKADFAEMWYEFLEFDSSVSDLTYVEEDDGDYMIRYYAMRISLPISEELSSTATAKEYRDDIDYFIEETQMDCPGTMCDHMGNSCSRWNWIATSEALVNSVLSGLGLAVPLAFVVLLISTRNWIVSVFALLDIIGVILCELATMYISGWTFGIVECISIVILIGFSVDYVVHLANAYLESKGDTRFERMSFALLTMAVSVLAGAITTALSSTALLFLKLAFFYKMGVIILTVIFYAFCWSLIFFTSIMLLFGPEGKQGDLNQYLAYFRRKQCDMESEEPGADVNEPNKKEEGNEKELTTTI